MLVSKAAKLQDAATKAWATGVFVLYANKITWQPSNPADASAPKELHIGLISITSELSIAHMYPWPCMPEVHQDMHAWRHGAQWSWAPHPYPRACCVHEGG